MSAPSDRARLQKAFMSSDPSDSMQLFRDHFLPWVRKLAESGPCRVLHFSI
jgi:hypothetical protein